MTLRSRLGAVMRRVERRAGRAVANVRLSCGRFRYRGRWLMPRPRPVPLFDDLRIVLGCFVAIALVAIFLDVPVALQMRARGDPGGVFARLTDLGLSGWFLVPSGLLVLAMLSVDMRASGRRGAAVASTVGGIAGYLFLVVGGAGLVAVIMKYSLGRARPKLIETLGAHDFTPFTLDAAHASFPSGHATTAGAVAVALGLLAPRWRVALAVVAVLVAMSRVMIGVHYPSDVLTGLFLGGFFAHRVAVAAARRRMVFEVAGDGTIKARGGRVLAASGGVLGALIGAGRAFRARPRDGTGNQFETVSETDAKNRSVAPRDPAANAGGGARGKRHRSLS